MYDVDATPDKLSDGVNVTVTLLVDHVGIAEIDVAGAVRSIFTDGDVTPAELSALSTTVADTDTDEPSPVIVEFAGHVFTPDNASAHDHCTPTSPLYQPAPFGDDVATPEPDGTVLSNFTVTDVDTDCPYTSVTVPVTTWLATSAFTVCGDVHDANAADDAHVNDTVTFELFQPAELGVGDTDPEMVGSGPATNTIWETNAEFPARSRTVPAAVWLPATVSTTGLGQAPGAMPDSASEHENVTVTGATRYPAAFGEPEIDATVIVGAVLSTLIPDTDTNVLLPAASTAVPDTD